MRVYFGDAIQGIVKAVRFLKQFEAVFLNNKKYAKKIYIKMFFLKSQKIKWNRMLHLNLIPVDFDNRNL